MKVTSRGRVTIPREFREQLGLQSGAEVEFRLEGEALWLIPAKKAHGRGRRIVEQLRGTAIFRMTTDEIMALMRGE